MRTNRKQREFEIVSSWEDKNINLPKRKTACSAGYDIESAVDIDIPPKRTRVVATGLKVKLNSNEFLYIFIRSSMAIKHGIILVNGTGVIDADYYNNEENEGHILCALYNMGDKVFHVKKGDRIAQGIFMNYGKVKNDKTNDKRTGGIGSTGK